MRIKFDQGLRPVLESVGGDLQIHADFQPAATVRELYLKGAFGNSYDFNQEDRLEDMF